MKMLKLFRGINKRLYRYFSYKVMKSDERKMIKEKIKKFNCPPLTADQKKEIIDYYSSFGFNKISLDWHRFYTHLTGNFYKEYIPEDFFYNVIEPSINFRLMFPALTDKNILDKMFVGVKQVKTILKNINGIYSVNNRDSILTFDEAVKICNEYDLLIIKPTLDSGGGKNVKLVKIKDGKTDLNGLSTADMLKSYNRNFIVQEYFQQHSHMTLLNESSVNTLRVKTLIVDNRIVILNTVVRIGKKGSPTDNMNSGGMISLVRDDGSLSEIGYSYSNEKVTKTDSNVLLKDAKIPNFDKVKLFVKELHLQCLFFKMISWDITIDKMGDPVLLEFNVFGQGVGQEYKTLFGEYTDEILKESNVNLFSF